MFKHILTYRLKILLRNKSLIFWTMVFPIVLASLFGLAFGNLGGIGTFQPIDVAVVDADAAFDDIGFLSMMEMLSKGDERLFNSQITDEIEAQTLLANGEIKGYILMGEEMTLFVNNSGFEQSIIKSFLDQYLQSVSAANRVLSIRAEALPEVLTALDNRQNFTREVSASRTNPNNTLIYFFALLAMTCLYSGFSGMTEVNDIQANLSVKAARINVAPVHKLKMFLYNITAAFVIQFVQLLVVLAYMVFVLSIDFGTREGLVVFTVFLGTIVGISFGAFISALVKGNENMKMGILLGVTMTGSLLAGMMFADIKYIVSTSAPVLAVINPVNLLADAFYALYFFDNYNRYIENIVGLSIFSVIFCTATYLIIRRQKYASL